MKSSSLAMAMVDSNEQHVISELRVANEILSRSSFVGKVGGLPLDVRPNGTLKRPLEFTR